MPDIILERPSVLLAKIETVKGTPETPGIADGAFNVFDLDVKETTPYIERPETGTAGNLPGVVGATAGTCTFRMNLHGKGSSGVPEWADTFLPACGYVKTGSTFSRTLDTSLQKTLTIVRYLGLGSTAIKQTLAGAVGTFRIVGRNGSPGDIFVDLMGKYWEEISGTPIDPTDTTVYPPRGYEAFQIGGVDALAPEWTLDAGVQRLLIEGQNDASKTGYVHGICTNFKPTLACEPYAEKLSVRDWRAAYVAGTQLSLNAVVGSAPNNTITLAGSKFQVSGGPGFGKREGASIRQLTFADNGGFTITFS